MTLSRSRSRSRLRTRLRLFVRDDTGAVTAEYAIVIMAAVALAGTLVTILRSGQVKQVLLDLVQRALTVA